MHANDFVTALAALLTQPDLQAGFARDPRQVADQLQLADHGRAMFIALSPDQISAQANLLISKRRKEVSKFLPQTCNQLGEDAKTLFESYAATYWPCTHRRHVEDAGQFCLYLTHKKLRVNQSEFNHLRFLLSGRRISLYIAKDALIKGRLSWAIQLFYRRNSIEGQWVVYFKG